MKTWSCHVPFWIIAALGLNAHAARAQELPFTAAPAPAVVVKEAASSEEVVPGETVTHWNGPTGNWMRGLKTNAGAGQAQETQIFLEPSDYAGPAPMHYWHGPFATMMRRVNENYGPMANDPPPREPAPLPPIQPVNLPYSQYPPNVAPPVPSAPWNFVTPPDPYLRWPGPIATCARKMGCWSHFNRWSCSSFKSECTFIFGSCRSFYGEPCMKAPPPTPVPPGVPVPGYPVPGYSGPGSGYSGPGSQTGGCCGR
jgi:hypothetical protein